MIFNVKKMFLLGICLIASLYPVLLGAYPLDSPSSLRDSPSSFKDFPSSLKESSSRFKGSSKDSPASFKDSQSSFKDALSSVKDTPKNFKDSPESFKESLSSFKDSPESFRDSLSSFKDSLKDTKVPAAPLADPSEYPDLTNGLTDAEVQATLQDLSLEDLNSLEELLDEHSNRDEDADREASLRDQGRKSKVKLDSSFKDLDQSVDDSCVDDADCEPASTTRRATTTTVCTTTVCTTKRCSKRPSSKRPKTTRTCKPPTPKPKECSDDFEAPKTAKPKSKCKTPRDEECEADDFLCLARKKEKMRELSSNIQAGADSEDAVAPLEAPAEYKPGRELAGIEQIDEDIFPPLNDQGELLGDSFDFLKEPMLQAEAQSNLELGNPVQLEEKHQPSIERQDPENEASLGEEHQVNLDNFKTGNQANLEQELPVNLELGNVASLEQTQPVGVEQSDKMRSQESEGQALLESLDSSRDSLRTKKAAEAEKPVEEQLPRLAEKQPLVGKEEPVPLKTDQGKQAPAFDADSFISNNARDPPRYLIQMQDGFIRSDNDPGERRLRADRSQSEALNLDKLAVKEASPFYEEDSKLETEYKRNKRENKETDDAPEKRI
ncbi:uncharacterized protein LOC6497928 isoform X2 [Drosophila ananassae]|uniref:uncharacterized protein LOC6497928 isoform X2 n=1 Tax=Drosophila ananassae TaxID=7217 RepID=UPI001CFF7B71|nr:uncharacterized protein LOC6497928 isoform X2 [Drosophila ananassae]